MKMLELVKQSNFIKMSKKVIKRKLIKELVEDIFDINIFHFSFLILFCKISITKHFFLRRAYDETDSDTSNSLLILKKQQSSLLESEEFTESDSDFQMLKLPTASQNYLPTKLFKPPTLESHETSSGSDLDLTNAQNCKFGRVVIENSEGASGNCSTTTHSSPPKSMKSPPLVQLLIISTINWMNKWIKNLTQAVHNKNDVSTSEHILWSGHR